MTKKEKIFKKFKQTPTTVNFLQINNILLDLGFKKRQGKGSHVVFYNGSDTFSLPVHNNDIKNIYKLKIHKTIFS